MKGTQGLLSKAKSILGQKDLHVQLAQYQCQGKLITHLCYEDIPTTMLPAQKWERQLLNQSDIYVFQAKSQSAGKGQKSNAWMSPPGNLYLTALCKIPQQLVSKLPMLVCSAMASACQEELAQSQKVSIKWVNDVYINDKKVGGTLIKTQFYQKAFITQIGIGINLNVSPNEIAGNLREYKQQDINIPDFTKRLIKNLVSSLNHPQQSIINYQESLLFLGENVKIYDFQLKQVQQSGKFKGINEYGHAILQIQGKDVAVYQGRMRS